MKCLEIVTAVGPMIVPVDDAEANDLVSRYEEISICPLERLREQNDALEALPKAYDYA